MSWWRKLHDRAWYVRWAVKGVAVALTLLLIAYPYPHLLARNVQRWRNPNTLIEPDNPRLQPMLTELQARLAPSLPPQKALRVVEKFVYEKVPYEWDWDTWGVADYIPTVDEVLDKGGEDCDGRAVIAASLHRALGHKADLVSDFAHVWVKTDRGETMGPRKSKSLVASDKGGTRIAWRTLLNVPRAVGYGIGCFPLLRELILVLVIWLALLRPGVRPAYAWLGGWLLVEGLLKLRVGGRHAVDAFNTWQLIGLAEIAVAVAIVYWAGRRARSRTVSSGRETLATLPGR